MGYTYECGVTGAGTWECTAIMACDHCGTEVVRGKSARNTPPLTEDQAQATMLTARANAQFAASVKHGTHSPVVDARGGCTCPACTARGVGPRDWFGDANMGANLRGRHGARVWRDRDPRGAWNAQAPRPVVVAAPPPPPPKRYAVTALRPVTGHTGWAEPVEVIAEPESAEPIVHGEMGANGVPCIVARPLATGGWSVAMLLMVDGIGYATKAAVPSRYEAQATVDAWVAAAPAAVECVRQGARYFPADAARAVAETQARQARARGAA